MHRSLAIAIAVLAGGAGPAAAKQKPPPAPSVVGRWRVIGCATSPRDPADCAHGTIAFGPTHWTVALPCCKADHDYTIVSSTADTLRISSGGTESEIRIDAKGEAHWSPGLGGRVGELTFVRDTIQ